MARKIKILAQYYDDITGNVLEEVVINDSEVLRAKTLRELGYLQKEQIGLHVPKMQKTPLVYCANNIFSKSLIFKGL